MDKPALSFVPTVFPIQGQGICSTGFHVLKAGKPIFPHESGLINRPMGKEKQGGKFKQDPPGFFAAAMPVKPKQAGFDAVLLRFETLVFIRKNTVFHNLFKCFIPLFLRPAQLRDQNTLIIKYYVCNSTYS